MSIRPIDMQVMIPKTSEIGKTQQAELQKPNSEQMQFSEQIQKHVTQNQQQVPETNKSEKNIIREDESKKNQSSNKNNKNNKNNKRKNNNENKNNSSTTSIFDVKI